MTGIPPAAILEADDETVAVMVEMLLAQADAQDQAAEQSQRARMRAQLGVRGG